MYPFKAYFKPFFIFTIGLILLMAWTSCKPSGTTGSSDKDTEDEIFMKKKPGYIIILGGGKTIGEAENAKELFSRRTFPFEYHGDYPKILLSDSIEGLNPGFQICVLGFCREKATAEMIRDLVNVTCEQVSYIKEVNHYMGYIDCPKIPFNQADYSDWSQVFSGPVKDNVPSIRWSLYSQSIYLEDMDYEVINYLLTVKQGKNEIARIGFEEVYYDPAMIAEEYVEEFGEYPEEEYPEEEYPEGEYPEEEMEEYGYEEEYPMEGYYEELGEQLTYKIEKFRMADRTFILVKIAHSAYDEITYEDKLYGFADGTIKVVADIFTGAEFTSPHVTYEFMPDYYPEDWKKMAILETVQYEHHSQTTFEWNDDLQEYEVVDSGEPVEFER